MTLRVAVMSYPMLFQSIGGLSMKVGRTVRALNSQGILAELIDPVRQRLTDFDVVHLFAPYNGNHRIVEQAKGDGLPVVISTILNPPFTRWDALRAEFLSRVVGKISRWGITTDYDQVRRAVHLADHLVALGEIERRMLTEGYRVEPEKVSVVYNGIGEEFFTATPDLFRAKYGISGPFVLHTGIIGDVKNQLGLVRALKGEPIDVVLVGYCSKANSAYLQSCLQEGGGRVRYLEQIEHGELIASAYAAAELIAVPSLHEGMPNTILEGLASDKPVVMTNNHTMDLALPEGVVAQVDAADLAGIRTAVQRLLRDRPAPGQARSVVAHLTWNAAAADLSRIYRRVLERDRPPRGRPADAPS